MNFLATIAGLLQAASYFALVWLAWSIHPLLGKAMIVVLLWTLLTVVVDMLREGKKKRETNK